jgi:hypothetical protein
MAGPWHGSALAWLGSQAPDPAGSIGIGDDADAKDLEEA